MPEGWINTDSGGDVTAGANITDNAVVRGDGGAKGIQGSGVTLDDSDNITGVNSLTLVTPLDETYGGTGQTTFTTGDILYASASNTLSKLAVGSNGEVLTLAAGVPSWAAASGGYDVSDFSGGKYYVIDDFIGNSNEFALNWSSHTSNGGS